MICPRCYRPTQDPRGCPECLAERAIEKAPCPYCGRHVPGATKTAHAHCERRRAAQRRREARA